jgi:hypothetical protein
VGRNGVPIGPSHPSAGGPGWAGAPSPTAKNMLRHSGSTPLLHVRESLKSAGAGAGGAGGAGAEGREVVNRMRQVHNPVHFCFQPRCVVPPLSHLTPSLFRLSLPGSASWTTSKSACSCVGPSSSSRTKTCRCAEPSFNAQPSAPPHRYQGST